MPTKQKIGKYEIKSVLGKGGMGVVYHGFDPIVERDVAIKTIHPHLIDDKSGKEYLARFIHEARAAARCTHPNIVTLLEYGSEDNAPFIAMEFINGEPLNSYLEKKDIKLKHVLKILLQLLKALHFAHNQGIVHRDIKPPNILISECGYIKLTDFGIARLPTSDLTQTGYSIGTPRYMSPEQAIGTQADQRSDLFSLGVVFLEMLSKIEPVSSIPTASIDKVEGIPPTVNIDFSIQYPSQLISVLTKSIQSDPLMRFQNASEFASAVQNALKTWAAQIESTMTKPAIPAFSLTVEEIEALKQELTIHMGPIADKLIDKELRTCTSKEALINNLAEKIPSGQDRQSFLNKLDTVEKPQTKQFDTDAPTKISSKTTPPMDCAYINETVLNELCSSYSDYLGPLAEVMVRKAVNKYSNLNQLIDALAEEIPDESERQVFLLNWQAL